MPRTRLIVHVAEPFDFGRMNGGTPDLSGWTAQATPAYSEWVIHLDRPGVIGEEEFDKIRVSSRYAGESVAKVLDGFGFTAVNIQYLRKDEDGRTYWHFAMTGNILLPPEKD